MPIKPSSRTFVFLDQGGKRWLRLRLITIIAIALLFVAFIAFIRSLYVVPTIRPPVEISDMASELKALAGHAEPIHDRSVPPKWLSGEKRNKHVSTNGPDPAGGLRLGYYLPWDPSSLKSLIQNESGLTHVAAEWFVMTDSTGDLMEQDNLELLNAVEETPLKIIPILTNLNNDKWYPEAVENLAFGAPEKRETFIRKVIRRLSDYPVHGVLIDWEELDPSYREEMTRFIGEFSEALHKNNLELWLTIPSNGDMRIFDLDALSGSVDHFTALLFDETGEEESGPIASRQWVKGWLDAFLKNREAKKWVIVLGNFGYDWSENRFPESIGFVDAMSRAYHSNLEPITSGEPYFEPHFSYMDNGVKHTVWFLDAVSFRNQKRQADTYHVGGIGIYRLGVEDPGVWTVWADNNRNTAADLSEIRTGEHLSHIGQGEILKFKDEDGEGERWIMAGEENIWIEKYIRYPQFPVIWHQGAKNKNDVHLSFDDGPDPFWTPHILDILKEKHVKASFFIIGSNGSRYPELLKRIIDEGHEIGNHTYTHPNLAGASNRRCMLELNATQRVIEGATGKSTALFRPPYDADTTPNKLSDCYPLLISQELGYVNVMESIDSEDWLEGSSVDEIIQRVKDRRREGNILLFHDSGGDRSRTLEALPLIIEWLRMRGDRIVPLSELIGVHPDELMPVITRGGSNSPQMVSSIGFTIIRYMEEFMWAFMIVATILVIARTGIIVFLAAIHKRGEERREDSDTMIDDPVSVIIAAFNEEKVIHSTLRSVLDTDYQGALEVIVVDDGSKDRTTEIVEAYAADDSRIRLIRQSNQGKAVALQNGIENARNEYLVMLDADTQFTPATISNLIVLLEDKAVGAVSGHAKVGNGTSKLAPRFQALEYTCGFNLDRRAYDVWNCITVAPGAVSAYRKSAIIEAGGISNDTLAEDTDLTLQLHRIGYEIRYTSKAVAWTEAPETFRSLVKQRKRWAFGTIQCLWKHRDLILNPTVPGLGFFSLPGLWFFQIFLVSIIPIVDFMLVVSVVTGSGSAIIGYGVCFLLIDLLLAGIACVMEKEPLTLAFNIIPMRILYRPLLSFAIWSSILNVMKGALVGWGKLERKGSVTPRGREKKVVELLEKKIG